MQSRVWCFQNSARRGWRGLDCAVDSIEKSFLNALTVQDSRMDGFGCTHENGNVCQRRGLSFSDEFDLTNLPPGSSFSNKWPPSDQRFTFQRLQKPPKPKPAPKKYPVDEVVALFKKTLQIFLKDRHTLHDYDWEKCREAALTDRESTTPHRLAHILNFCKRTEKVDVEFLGCLMKCVLIDPTAPSEITPVEASMVVQSIGMLSRVDSQKRGSEFFTSVGRPFVVNLLEECSARDLFSHRRFRPWELSNTLHGLGVLLQSTGGLDRGEIPIVEKAVKRILQEFMKKTWFQGREAEFAPQDFANVLHGCVNLVRFCDVDRELVMGVVENLKATLSTQVPMSEQDLANVVWALGKLGIKYREVLDVLCQRMAEIVETFKAKSLSNIVYGLGLLRFHKKGLMIKIGKQVGSSERIHEFKMQELTNIVYGFGLSGFFEARIFMILLKQISRRTEKFSAREVSNIVYGLGLLKPQGIDMISKSVGSFMDILVTDVLGRNRKSFNSQDVANLCWGCGRLLFYDEELMGFLVGRYMELVETRQNIRDFEVRMILEACHALDYPAQDFHDFAKEALQDVDGRGSQSSRSGEQDQAGTNSAMERYVTGTSGAGVRNQRNTECYRAVIDELADVDGTSIVNSNGDQTSHKDTQGNRVMPHRSGRGRNEYGEESVRYSGRDQRVQRNGGSEGWKSWGEVLRESRTRREKIKLYQEFNDLADEDQSSLGQREGAEKPPL